MYTEMANGCRELTAPHQIRFSATKRNRVDPDEVRRLMLYLGGTVVGDAFRFPSEQRCAEALEVLVHRYGPRYFDLVDAKEEDSC